MEQVARRLYQMESAQVTGYNYVFFRIHEAAMSKVGNIEEMRP